MAEVLKARAASFVNDDGAEVQYTTGPLPDDIPADHLAALREQDALAEADEPTALDVTGAADVPGRPDLDSVMHVDPDPDTPTVPGDQTHETSELYAGAESGTPPGGDGESGSASSRGEPSADLPGDAPDASQEDVGTLARYIDSESLNAAQTVALAEGDPELAAKVLDAERTAQGGDPRVTVERPLSKLAARRQPAADTTAPTAAPDVTAPPTAAPATAPPPVPPGAPRPT